MSEESNVSIETNKIINRTYIMIGIIILVIVPVLLNVIMKNNNFYEKANNEGWISFWGSYIGGIFGGLVTLIALTKTTKQSQESQRDSFKLTREIQKQNVEESRKLLMIQILNEKINDYNKINEPTKQILDGPLCGSFIIKFSDFTDIGDIVGYFNEFSHLTGSLFKKALCLEEDEFIKRIKVIQTINSKIILEYYEEIFKNFKKDNYNSILIDCSKLLNDLSDNIIMLRSELDVQIEHLYKKKYNLSKEAE
ncbi:hypothetical protein [Clostridium gasigenes]|uniref:hypothetical protein n=1 Tax=Clostridium gasigenes TaxID=94869 RepID=UPI001C0B60C2|nr:hypothetical protein [Clostridium gasigenes]MBU3107154.1 hypothetical protein [Clostridium gasigenes]